MASRGVNKAIIIGNLGSDPEVRYMQSGSPVATLSVATSEGWKDKETGQPQERTEWHRIVLFNRLGEIAGEYLKKGSKVYIEGSIRTRKWQDKSGADRYTTEIVGNSLQMLDSRGGNQGGGNDFGGGASQGGGYQQQNSGGGSSSYNNQSSNQDTESAFPNSGLGTESFEDDDIPF